MSASLTPERARIFRITHRSNVAWILGNGMHCANSEVRDPRFVQIGNADLIGRRRERGVGGPYGGTLSDYVPFYFTPFSPMFLNIITGRGVPRQPKRDIVVFATSIWQLEELGVPFVISDRHAFVETAQFTADCKEGLGWQDWPRLQARDFKRDPFDPGKFERYEAETLVFQHVPPAAFLDVYTYDEAAAQEVRVAAEHCGNQLNIVARPQAYF